MGRPHQYTAEIGPVEGLGRAVQVVGGYYYSLALRSDGTVAAWGNGADGQLGLGQKLKTTETPTTVTGLPAIKTIAAGPTISFALTTTGDVYGWGANDRNQLGPYAKKVFNPVPVSGISNVVSIAAGFGNVVALKGDGTVWTWGSNTSGALGNGTTTDLAVPTQVPSLSGIVQISAGGSRVYALKSNGTVWAWGSNSGGTLGVGDTAPTLVTTPTQVPGLSLIKEISANVSHTLVLRDDGLVMSWGLNDLGQLGDPSKTSTYPGTKEPSIVPGLSNVANIGTGGSASFAVDRDGFPWLFGRGDGCLPSYKVTSPTLVPGINKVLTVGGGYMHPLFLSNTTTPIWASTPTAGSVIPYDKPSMRVSIEGGTETDLELTLSSASTLVGMPAKATIPAGSSYIDIPLNCPNPTPDYTVVPLKASRGKVVATAGLYLVPPVLYLSVSPEPQAGDIAGATVKLNYAAPAGGLDVALTSNHPEMIDLPASVHIAEGTFQSLVQFPTKPSASNVLVTIKATLGAKQTESQMHIRANAIGTMEYSSPTVPSGMPVDLKFTLAAPAPAGGTTITLLASSAQYFTMPASVTVPSGSKEATVTIQTNPTNVVVDAAVTAYVTGSTAKSRYFKILPSTIKEIALTKESVLGGDPSKLKISLDGVSTGVTLTLTSADPSVIVPASVTIPAGKSSVNVVVNTTTVEANKNVTIKVKMGSQTVSTKLLVTTKQASLKTLTIDPTTVMGPANLSGNLELTFPAVSDGVIVTLTSSDPSIVTVPATVKVGKGKQTATFGFSTIRVKTVTNVTITATADGVTKQVTLTINPKPKG